MNLRPYQSIAADFLFANDRAMILAPVGAGKTAITLTAMREMLRDGHATRFLVLAPKRVLSCLCLARKKISAFYFFKKKKPWRFTSKLDEIQCCHLACQFERVSLV